jgi:hypothetical protein
MPVQNITIDSLKSKILRPALTSHYVCDITIPNNPSINKFFEPLGDYTKISDILSLSCCEASLPGSSIATHDLNNDFTGVTQRHAYRRLYDDRADFTFYVNINYIQISFFETWMRYITGEQIADSESPNKFYRIEYPTNYKAPMIKIFKFEKDAGGQVLGGNPTTEDLRPKQIEYRFINAFPSNINSMPVSYDGAQLLKCTVSFIYDRYVSINVANSISAKSFIPAAKSSALNSPNQPQPAIPAGVAQSPYLQSQFNISQFAYSGSDYSNTFANINEPLF